MREEHLVTFGAFRLDLANECLWREAERLRLPPKDFAVLRYLIERAGQLVTKDELFQTVWAETVVSDAALTKCVRAVRQMLGDEAKTPQFIETVHRRGYRFIALVAASAAPVSSFKFQVPGSDTQPSALRTQHSVLVGRETELAQLHRWLEKALGGERQIVFVTGEPGIGKTTLIEAFLQSLESRVQRLASENQPSPFPTVRTLDPRPQTLDRSVWIGRGQCIEHYGAGEAYLPVLDALGRLCRGPGGHQMIALLAQHAPTWLVQMPALLDATELESLQRKTAGATRERMLRELAEALEALTVERPLMLWLEDLHWSDSSTLEWLAFVARRRELARVLIVGTYRPVEMLSEGHPLKRVTQELYAHQLGNELAMRRLNETEVSAYLTLRFPESVLPTRLGQVLQQRTGGNPLFLASLVQELLQRRVILQEEDGRWEWHGSMAELETWTPESVRQLLARQRERLAPDDQRVLEAASLAGLEFSAATVAAALEAEAIQVEDHCGRLAEQQQFLRLAGMSEWPDGTQTARYGFLHALYQEFWHERVSVGKQQQWHLRIGERQEAAYGQRAGEIAAELALHFEQGQEYRKAVRYLQQAGQNAAQRSAYVEAISHFTKGLELLKTLPDTPERTQQELILQVPLGGLLQATKGYSAPEVEKVFAWARELCREVGETPQLLPVLEGLVVFYLVRGKLHTARELGEQCFSLAQRMYDPVHLLQSHHLLGLTLFYLGKFGSSREHLERGVALYDFQQCRSLAVLSGVVDPGVACLCYAAWVLWMLGYPDQALKRSHEALTLAQELAHPLSLAFALDLAACWLHQFRREGQDTQERAEALIALSAEQGFEPWSAEGIMLRGWALAEQGKREEGIEQMHQGLAAIRATGAEFERPYWLALLAEAYGKVGRAEEGLSALAEALAQVDKTGVRFYEVELCRLKGQLTLQKFQVSGSKFQVENSSESGVRSSESEAEEYFLKAVEIARRQSAKSWELRAVMSLSQLWQSQGKREEARQMLTEIYSWFTEGFDTKDLQEAKALLEELSH